MRFFGLGPDDTHVSTFFKTNLSLLTTYFSRQGKRYAFTLAETLITLGIIGVVAAVTLPTVIQKYNEKVWVTSFLRVYSLLENAYKQAIIENGTFENWFGGTITVNSNGTRDRSQSNRNALYEVMLKPYLKINNIHIGWNNKGCMSKKAYLLNGDEFRRNCDYTISLPSGECIELGNGNGDFVVDVNSQKGPNTLGKDIFVFSFDITKPERIKPAFFQSMWTDTPAYCDVNSSHGWSAGMSCGFWIVRNHNMDYLHMPYEELKKKWKGWVW